MDWGPPGGWEGVGSLPTASHRPGGTPPSEGGVPPPRWAEPNYPSVINKPAATRPHAFDKFMTEATSMVLPAIKLKFSVGAVARVRVAGSALHQTRTLGTAHPVEATVCKLLG